MDNKIRILYLDDEEHNLFGFKATFRYDYEIFTAKTIEEAYNVLENTADLQIIFCDQKMPVKTGVEFFEEIRYKYPHPIRILLTAYTEIDAIVDAINLGNIFRYIKKPWVEADIQSAVVEASKFYLTNSQLSIRNEELRKAYIELDKFAYSVTHDIRGPLSGILGAINISKDINNVVELKDILLLMEQSVNKLDDFILNMHDYYSVQRGELRITEIDFNDIVSDIKGINQAYTKAKHVSLMTNIVQNYSFRGHEYSLKLIINNLLSNAFKYQKDAERNKSVQLDVKVEKGTATISIKDNGIGILKEHIENIFNLFYRATSQASGSGFGLYNVKNAVLKLNGKIDVKSTVNEGTEFKVIIPDK